MPLRRSGFAGEHPEHEITEAETAEAEATEAVPDDQAAEVATPEPPAGDATAEEITQLAKQCDQGAEAATLLARGSKGQYDARMEAVREKAARMIADEEAQARHLAETSTEAQQSADELTETGRRLRIAADYATKAEATEATVRALEAEWDGLTAGEAEISGKLAELAAQKSDLESRLAVALDSDDGDDGDLIIRLQNELESVSAREDARRAKQAPMLARLEVIGDGEMSPIWPQKELAEARRVAHGARSQAAAALNAALPDRPEAAAARAHAHEQLLDRVEADHLAAERQAAQYAQPRTFVAGRR